MQTVTIVGNWKMNTTPSSARVLAASIMDIISDDFGAKIVVCPPSVALESVSQVLHGSRIVVGAQNIHHETDGAFTGEISAQMVREVADYVIVGHSERRHHFGESDDFIRRKVVAALGVGLKPILCVGESSAERRAGFAERVVVEQIAADLDGFDNASDISVAYEPVWAIGTGESATPDTAQEMMSVIRATLKSQFGGEASAVPCLYGGSVNPGNIEDLIRQPDIDGALVGSASLNAKTFCSIVTRAVGAI